MAIRCAAVFWNCSPSAEHASGEVVAVIAAEFGISRAGVSQHLKVLRDAGFA
ncbi:ArsR family transcriptional regulator [Devosia sp. A8/3-2]|nr:ArsR family transcriptional regulator [Devosia sp. A8/3-2]